MTTCYYNNSEKKQQHKNNNNKHDILLLLLFKGCTHGAIVIAIYLSQQNDWMEFNIIVPIVPCEHLH